MAPHEFNVIPRTTTDEFNVLPRVRMEEHRKEDGRSEIRPYTRFSKSVAASDIHKSAITDHVLMDKHVMDWDNISVLDREEDHTKRWIKDAIWIRKSTPVIIRDEGAINCRISCIIIYDHHTDIW